MTEGKEEEQVPISKLRVIVLYCIILSFAFGSLVSLPVASAQGAPSYGLSAGVGDWATYRVDEFSSSAPTLYYPYWSIREGDNLTFYVDSFSNFSTYDNNNKTVMSWVTATTSCVLNGTDSFSIVGSIVFGIPLFSTSLYLEPFVYPGNMLPFPFLPSGESFWTAIEPYVPNLQTALSPSMVTLTYQSNQHYSVTSAGTTQEYNYSYSFKANVNDVTGVLSKYEESYSYGYDYEYPGNSYNYSYYDSVAMTLIDTSVHQGPEYASSPLVVISVSAVPALSVILVALFSTRRRVRIGAISKTEALSRLSNEDLMKLATGVLGNQIDREMDRNELIRIVKQSLSLEEINARLKAE